MVRATIDLGCIIKKTPTAWGAVGDCGLGGDGDYGQTARTGSPMRQSSTHQSQPSELAQSWYASPRP